jgi:phage shock protein PspC (stress-responsive transcriptional regulator)
LNGRLTRSRTDRVLGGVCGGLGAYFKIDPLLVRIFFILLALGNGIGVAIYLLLWILVPPEGSTAVSTDQTIRTGASEIAGRAEEIGEGVRQVVSGPPGRAGAAIGIGLIVLGGVFFLRMLDLPWLRGLDWDVLWPLLLIAAGVALLWRRAKGS